MNLTLKSCQLLNKLQLFAWFLRILSSIGNLNAHNNKYDIALNLSYENRHIPVRSRVYSDFPSLLIKEQGN